MEKLKKLSEISEFPGLRYNIIWRTSIRTKDTNFSSLACIKLNLWQFLTFSKSFCKFLFKKFQILIFLRIMHRLSITIDATIREFQYIFSARSFSATKRVFVERRVTNLRDEGGTERTNFLLFNFSCSLTFACE
jgi:hypothetical protein